MKYIYLTVRMAPVHQGGMQSRLTGYLWHPRDPFLAEELSLWRQSLWIIQRADNNISKLILHRVLHKDFSNR